MRNARKTTRKTASLLLRGLDRELVDIFKARAERHGRSLQAELQLSLRREAHRNFDEARRISEQWHEKLGGRTLGKTTSMIDEDRQR
jgi:plasmid stability protein